MCWYLAYYEKKIFAIPRASTTQYAQVNKPEKPRWFHLVPCQIEGKTVHSVERWARACDLFGATKGRHAAGRTTE